MIPRLLLLTAALMACDPSTAKQDPTARDLSRALNPPAAPADTAAQRKRAQLERCKYVYHDEQGLRECLVLKNAWSTQDAAREIAVYKAEIARLADSVRQVADSLDQAQMLAEKQRAAAERSAARASDSVRLLTSIRPWAACLRQVLRADTVVTRVEMQEACGGGPTGEQFRRWSIYEHPKDVHVLETWVQGRE